MRSWYGSSRFQKGFTILELMTALAITAVLVAMAAPGFRDSSANSSMRSATIDLITALNTARSEAVSRRTDVTVSAVNANWSEGWVIDYPGANNEDMVFTPNKGLVVTGSETSIVYRSNGTTSHNILTLSVCDGRDGETGREITINRMGRLENKEFSC